MVRWAKLSLVSSKVIRGQMQERQKAFRSRDEETIKSLPCFLHIFGGIWRENGYLKGMEDRKQRGVWFAGIRHERDGKRDMELN